MRITILILGFAFGALMFAQTFLIYGLANFLEDTTSGRAATAGLGMVGLWILGVAFIFGVPIVSIVVFLIAGFVGIANSESFGDLQIWGGASIVLAGLSAMVVYQDRHSSPRSTTRRLVAQREEGTHCPYCSTVVAPGHRFCSRCGRDVAPRRCPTCDNPVSWDSLFCGSCGTALVPTVAKEPNSPAVAQPAEELFAASPVTRQRRFRPLMFSAIAFFLLAQIGTWFRAAGQPGPWTLVGPIAMLCLIGWAILWVRRNGRGGLMLPERVWSFLHVPKRDSSDGGIHDRQAAPRFPRALTAGAIVLAGVLSFVAAALSGYTGIRVVGSGMEPAFPDKTMFAVQLRAYESRNPSRGDVILYDDTTSMGRSIKRVIGLPGEHIQIQDKSVHVNGVRLTEPYAQGSTNCRSGPHCDVTLGPDEYYLLGDNRTNSSDSRVSGPIERSRLRGQVVSQYWPIVFPWR